jgi:8-oxo-dGTP pyrophosphatase MutT (NUDIX family)
MLVRDTERGIEVLMVRRPAGGFFGGLTVFPGGAVDADDDSDLASQVVSSDDPDRVYRVAALRELAEETGIALTDRGMLPAPRGKGIALLQAIGDAGLTLDGSALTLVSRWVTPAYAPTRYDTRFFLARAEDAPDIRLDISELVDHMWVTPAVALHRQEIGELEMFLPTISHLRWLQHHSTVDDAVGSAAGANGRSLIQPQLMGDGSIVPIHMPVDE